LIANGEQSGTWGTTTNTNLGTLIEDAISGYVSVSVISANQALTAVDGGADQSRNMVINLTTTTSAAFNVYIPPAEKFYVIRNSSAYDATIYCSTVLGNTTAAGTGVTVLAGTTTMIFADGTNVASSLTAFSGNLVVSANSSSPALRVTQTGSGNSILVEDSANPDATPFVVTATGDVGIGTLSPTNLLSVAGNANITGNTTLGDASTDTVTVNGYMGVGAAASSAVSLYLQGTHSGTAADIYAARVTQTIPTTTTGSWTAFTSINNTTAASTSITSAVGFLAGNFAALGAGSTLTNQYGIFVADQTRATNNYGIGSAVSSGTDKWNIYASGTAANYFKGYLLASETRTAVPNGAAVRSLVSQGAGAYTLWWRSATSVGGGYIGTDGPNLIFGNATGSEGAETYTERMRIDSSGNVGIGTTTVAAKLHLNQGFQVIDKGTFAATKFNSQGVAWNSVATTPSLVFNADAADRPEISWIRGANTYPEFSIRQHTTANLGGQFWVGGGTVAPSLVASVVPNAFLIGTGASQSLSNGGVTGNLQIETANGSTNASMVRNTANANGPIFAFGKSRGAALGSRTIVASGDILGVINFDGADGTNMLDAASILAQVDGTPGTNDMPGRLVFSTTADGGSSPTERMRIDSSGNLGLGVTPSAWGSPSYAVLQTYTLGIVNTPGGGTNTTTFATNSFYNGTNWIYRNTAAASRYDHFGDTHRWLNTPSGTAGTAITWTQAMTLDASGRLLVGTTSVRSGYSYGLVIEGVTGGYAAGAGFVRNTADTAGSAIQFGKSRGTTAGSVTAVVSGDSLGTLLFQGADGTGMISAAGIVAQVDGTPGTNDMPGRLVFTTTADGASSPTERMRIDSSGNVGIGTSSPGTRLHVNSGAIDEVARFEGTGSPYISFYDSGVREFYIENGAIVRLAVEANKALAFLTNNTERARIDSSGNLLVGASANPGLSWTSANRLFADQTAADFTCHVRNSSGTAANNYGIAISFGATPNGTGNAFIEARDATAQRFQVRSNGGIANFSGNNVNLSDRREKTNFAPAGDYLSKICAIPVQTFNYIDQNMEEDPGLTLGVVAQEVQDVAPELVMESNWGTAEEPKMRLSIYQTDLQYALMKCIQEQQQMIETLQAKVAALEGKK
jgi:hypothetical protein